MYAIEISALFAAGHQLRLGPGQLEPSHGHNWSVVVRVASPQLDAIDTVMDFHDLEQALEAIIGPWRNRHLNDVAPFLAGVNPSAERVAEVIGQNIAKSLKPPARVVEVRIGEAPGCTAIWMNAEE